MSRPSSLAPHALLRFQLRLVAASLVAAVATPQSSPLIPGLERAHGLDPAAAGRVLLGELGCTACHASSSRPAPAPDLAGLSRRTSADWVEDYLVAPGRTRHGARMPRLLVGAESEQVARELTHYLFGRGADHTSELPRGEAADAGRGAQLFHSIGCVACHAPRESAFPGEPPPRPAGAVSLDHATAKFTRSSLATFLFDPLEARPAGRMPDMKLTRSEARDLAAYLLTEPGGREPLSVDAALARRGEQHYERLACASCHEPGGRPTAQPLAELDPSRGCLDERDPSTPRYDLSREQRDALLAALAADQQPSPTARVHESLTALNCLACHVRGDHGGVTAELDPYFGTDEPELGDSARIPPELTHVGAKLQDEWLRKVLLDGLEVRPYMHTRMPMFGAAPLAELPELLAAADELEPYPLRFPKQGEETRELRDGARELLGTKGLGCVSCHDFNGKPSPGFGGMDLITTYDRLQPDWFARFLIAPQVYRPGIVMPESWPDGEAVHSKILAGDTQRQLEAIWHYLSLGTSAGDPPGIQRKPTNLVVEDEVRTYRGRSRVAGFRGITVGFPGGLSYAFDAQNGALSAIWRGDWISVYWGGQGAGDFNPRARAVELGRDVAFYRLEDAEQPWPLRPFMDEKNPVNPDPLYPKNRGYEFRGYSLDDAFVPTLEYWTGNVQVLDTTRTVEGAQHTLRRSLRLSTQESQKLWFRVVAGEWEEAGDQVRLGRLLLTPPDGARLVREFQTQASKPEEVKTQRELLVELEVSAGQNTVTIDYEVQP